MPKQASGANASRRRNRASDRYTDVASSSHCPVDYPPPPSYHNAIGSASNQATSTAGRSTIRPRSHGQNENAIMSPMPFRLRETLRPPNSTASQPQSPRASRRTQTAAANSALQLTPKNEPLSDFAALLREAAPSTTRPASTYRAKMVIAIDFGTTFSGVAYALVQPYDDAEDVRVYTVRDWEGRLPGRAISDKVPTLIAFDDQDEDKPRWGFDIPSRLNEKTIKFVKLLLEPDVSRRVSSLNTVVNPEATSKLLRSSMPVRSPVDVAAQYVKCLWEHAKQQIIRHVSQATFNYAEKVILFTVPAVWSERAKHNTYMIAVGAGLANPEYSLQMISEPEAAAVAVLRDRIRAASLVQKDVYVVVDAGGGTVDLTSYQVDSIEPLRLKEVAPGAGDVCGAAFLEVNFRRLLRTYIGATLDSLDPFNENRIICDWEDSVRATFSGTDDERYAIVTPGIPNDVSVRVNNGLMHLQAAEILPIFDPVIDKIERLVQKQLSALTARNLKAKAIVLVGGLGCNRYLAKRLRQRYDPAELGDGETRIEVQQPDTAWESVAFGAVKCELLGFGSLVSLRMARYNIGFTISTHWDKKRFLPEQKYRDPYDGHHRAAGVIDWSLRRNDALTGDRKFTSIHGKWWESKIDMVLASDQSPKVLISATRLIASDQDEAPEYPTQHTRSFATVIMPWDLLRFPKDIFPLRHSVAGKPYRTVRYDLEMSQSMAGMKFVLHICGQHVGDLADVEFHSLPESIDGAEAFTMRQALYWRRYGEWSEDDCEESS